MNVLDPSPARDPLGMAGKGLAMTELLEMLDPVSILDARGGAIHRGDAAAGGVADLVICSRAECLQSGAVDRQPAIVAIRLTARASTGFFPNHAPRLWEYPWIADALIGLLPGRGRLVDIGAGVSPIGPYLERQGFEVETVDPSPIRRQWPVRSDWNEWEFLDYAAAGFARRSWNCSLHDLPEQTTFDGAYTISVVEHAPAESRRAMWPEIERRLRPGGILVATVDVLRGTQELWNRCRGDEVEEPAVHGTMPDVVAEVASAGLEPITSGVVRDWGDVPVDIGVLVARRPAI